jgi:hypothetical protein
MARREWAHVKGQKTPKRLGETDIEFCARVAKAEHARAVRIVREVVKHAAHMERQTKVNREMNAYWQGKLDGAENILAGLRKGRA